MKKEELIALGVSEDIAKQIMAINGTDIEAAKAKTGQATEKVTQELENLKSELESNKQTLEQANAQIEKFKGLDVEGIKAQAEEWKNKYSEFETKSKADKEAFETQLKQQAYEFKLSEATGQLNFPNELTKKAFMNELKTKNLPLEGEKILGFEDYVKEIGEQNPGMFVVETPSNEPKLPEFTTQNTNQTTPTDTGFNFSFTPVNKK